MTLEARAMIVEGAEIPKSTISVIIKRMKGKKPFRCSEIVAIAMKKLEEHLIQSKTERPYIAQRLADRMIQKARKAGAIKCGTEKGQLRLWGWVAER